MLHHTWSWTFPGISHLAPLWAACDGVLPLIIKNFFYLSNLNLTSFSLKVLPSIQYNSPSKNPVPTFMPIWKATTQILHFSRLNNQFFQCLLIEETSHSSDPFCDPLLDWFLQAPVLSVPRAGWNTLGGSQHSRVEGQNPLPWPVGHTSDAAQPTADFLGYECILPAHIQLFIHQYSQVLPCRAALNPFIPSLYW